MSTPVVDVQHFRKTYGNFVAINDISFQVEAGEVFGLLGPNGAGKTSTLESLEGLRPPDGGVLRVAGVDPTREPQNLRNKIGVQLQTSGLPDNVRVDEVMRFFCAYHGVEPRFELLHRLGLGSKLSTQYYQLSTGQKRRLALVLAVVHGPEVLFLDEPTAGLDVATRVELHNLMRELQDAGTTIILATHDMAEAEEMADRVAILLNGTIVARGTPMELTAAGRGLTKVSVRTSDSCLMKAGSGFPNASPPTVKGEYSIYFSTDVGKTVGALIEYVEKQGDTLIDLRVERPSLEDRFLEITSIGGAT